MRAEEVKGLMEAYSHVYETPEVSDEQIFEDWMYSFVEEGYDLSEFDWDSSYDETLDEAFGSEFVQRGGIAGALGRAQARAKQDGGASNRAWLGNKVKGFFDAQSRFVQRGGIAGALGRAQARAKQDGGASNRAWLANKLGFGGSNKPAAKPATPAKPAAKPAAPAAAAKPAATSAAKPSAPTSPAAKPMSAMDQWAKANPKLAQAQKIRQQGGSRAEVNKVLYDKGTAAAEKTPTVVKAGVDIFDLVKGHLLDEGYADSEDAAMVIMVNMSEEWRESILESYNVELGESSKTDDATRARIKMFAGKKGISFEPGPRWDASANRGKGAHLSDKQVEKQRRKKLRSEEYMDEAQGARENPEDHDKEEKKKYEKVRGEKTPMPPRGDKRREDFEKWYRANVR